MPPLVSLTWTTLLLNASHRRLGDPGNTMCPGHQQPQKTVHWVCLVGDDLVALSQR